MAGKPFWRSTSLGAINVVLYLVVLGLALGYWDELRWSAHQLPKYLSGKVGSPTERILYREARHLMEGDGDWRQAESLLRISLSIDPTTSSSFWLAESLREQGRIEEALAQYEHALSVDPMRYKIYTRIAEIHAANGDVDQALGIARQGLRYFERLASLYRPRADPTVSQKFVDKSRKVHSHYLDSSYKLAAMVERLEIGPGGQSESRPASGS